MATKKKTAPKKATAKKTAPKKAKKGASKAGKSTVTPELKLVMEMMAIEGISCEEGKVAEFIRKMLLAAGAPASAIKFDQAHRRTVRPGDVGNLVLKLPGKGAAAVRRAPRRLLMAHMDTVPVCVGSQPVLKDGYIESADPNTGLGADDRAGAAAVLLAALDVLNRDEHPPVTFFWTVQEEIGIHGVRHATMGLLGDPKLAFNFDGGSPSKMTIGATGGFRMTIDVTGLASHAGGAPERGVSAIAISSLAIADLQTNGWHGLIEKGRRRGTSNIGVFEGGAATNVVCDRVHVRAEARSHDSKFRERIVAEIEKAFRRAAASVKNVVGKSGSVTFKGQLDYDSFKLGKKEPSLLAAEEAVRRVGGKPIHAVTDGGLDANWMTKRGVPTVTLGCGQLNQHMVTERLDVADYLDACEIAKILAGEVAL